MKKGVKGQGQIITTILIILLVLAAIVIVWQVVKNTVTTSSEEVDITKITFGGDIESFTVNEAGSFASVVIKRNNIKGAIKGVRLIFEDEAGNTYSNSSDIYPEVLETKTYTITSLDLTPLISDLGTLSKVSLFYFYEKSGEDKLTNLIDSEKRVVETVTPPAGCTDNSGCDDGDACTTDTCNAGICSNVAINCDDENTCNGVETCVDGTCVSGTPLPAGTCLGPELIDDPNLDSASDWILTGGCDYGYYKPGTITCSDYGEGIEEKYPFEVEEGKKYNVTILVEGNVCNKGTYDFELGGWFNSREEESRSSSFIIEVLILEKDGIKLVVTGTYPECTFTSISIKEVLN